MGAFLGQEDSLSVRNQKFNDNELGIDPVSIATTGSAIAKPVKNIVSSIFGGSSCSGDQKRQREEIRQAISQYLTAAERQELVRGMESDVDPTPESMARFYMGGRDCKHKNVTPGDQRFLDRLPVKIQQKAQQAQSLPTTTPANQSANLPAATAAMVSPGGLDPMTLLKIGGTILVLGGSGYAIWQLTQK